MDKYHFKQLTDEDIPLFKSEMYAILYQNMHSIAPTGNPYEEDYLDWLTRVEPAWRAGKRSVILIFSDDALCGFFQYAVREDTFRMDEIQFRQEYQGSGLFAELYRYLTTIIPAQTKYADAFSQKENSKSQQILRHLGLKAEGESNSGDFLYFKGEYKTILERYSQRTERRYSNG